MSIREEPTVKYIILSGFFMPMILNGEEIRIVGSLSANEETKVQEAGIKRHIGYAYQRIRVL